MAIRKEKGKLMVITTKEYSTKNESAQRTKTISGKQNFIRKNNDNDKLWCDHYKTLCYIKTSVENFIRSLKV